MCGIFAIVSEEGNIVPVLIDGLKKLEYRGYDSAGIAIFKEEEIEVYKGTEKVSELGKKTEKIESNIGIAHTRWATHGKPSELNSHPHLSSDNNICIVHNGIIENYNELKNELIKKGYTFKSDTDTEVAANLIADCFKNKNEPLEAIPEAMKKIEGSYAFAVLFKGYKKVFIAKKDAPLIVGKGIHENYISSGISGFSNLTNQIITLEDGDYGWIDSNEIKLYNLGKEVNRKLETIDINDTTVDKGTFEHFMLKEIFDQPDVVKRTLTEYTDNNKVVLPKFSFDLSKLERLTIVACGTSYYAGCMVKYFFEKIAKVKIDIDIASEFRYRDTPLDKNGVALFISQSGETADTIGALKYCKEHGQKIISLVNVFQSTIASLSDVVLKTFAGAEIGVASTKAFTAQVLVLSLLGLEIARLKGIIDNEYFKNFLNEVKKLPEMIEKVLSQKDNISKISENLKKAEFVIYLGRGIYYPAALESSLKLKEISYIPTDGVAMGELKHGPIALIDKNLPVFAISPSCDLFDKSISSLEEVIAREGKITLIGDKIAIDKLKDKVVDFIEIPESTNIIVSALTSVIPGQLISYYTALHKGNSIDKPRNLAKSVTVE